MKRIAFNVRDRHRLGKHGGERVYLSVVDVSVEEPPDVLVACDEFDRQARVSVLCSRCPDVSHPVNRDVLTDLALLKECVRLGRDDAAIRDGDQYLCRCIVHRCRQLLLRCAEDRRYWTEGIELVGEAEDTQGLTVLEEPSQDTEVRLEIQRSGCADDARSLEAEAPGSVTQDSPAPRSSSSSAARTAATSTPLRRCTAASFAPVSDRPAQERREALGVPPAGRARHGPF